MYAAAISAFDAVILDVGLPRLDGFAVCRRLREGGSDVPVLMLTARDAVEARIEGLDSGADDYLTKPFDFGELLARLRALIRRGRRPLTPSVLRAGPLELDLRARRATREGRPLLLTAREYARARTSGVARERRRRPCRADRTRVGSRPRAGVEHHRRLRAAAAPEDRRRWSTIAHRHAAERRVHAVSGSLAVIWSIRARLTAWYSGVVVIVLIAGAVGRPGRAGSSVASASRRGARSSDADPPGRHADGVRRRPQHPGLGRRSQHRGGRARSNARADAARWTAARRVGTSPGRRMASAGTAWSDSRPSISAGSRPARSSSTSPIRSSVRRGGGGAAARSARREPGTGARARGGSRCRADRRGPRRLARGPSDPQTAGRHGGAGGVHLRGRARRRVCIRRMPRTSSVAWRSRSTACSIA